MTRREFLKKTGLGAAGLSALALLPFTSALNIKSSNPIQYFNSSRGSNPNFKVDSSGDISGSNADLVEIIADRVTANDELKVPTSDNTGNNRQVWLDKDNQELKARYNNTTYKTSLTSASVPDGTVTRPDDTGSGSFSDVERGILIETGASYDELGCRISDNSTGMQTAYLRDQDNGGTIIDQIDVSALSPNDTFSFEVSIPMNTKLSIAADWDTSTGEYGQTGDLTNYPYTDASVDIDIINGFSDGSTIQNAYFVNAVGNVGL